MTTRRVALTDLVEDWDLYPRHAVDAAHVSALAEAIRAGDELPPLRVDARTLRIVDGFHRARAFRKVLGDGAQIKVDARTYASETEILQEAIRLNAAHGRKLDSQDRTKSVLMLERRGVDTATIAVTLHITEPTVERIRVKVAVVEDSTGHEETVAVKPILWAKGSEPPRRITPEQYETQKSSSGLRPMQVVTQLIREVRDEVVNLNDPDLCARLWELHAVIAERVPVPEHAST